MKRLLGFTLIEMLVTIGILGIVVAIALPSYTAHIEKVRRTEATTGLYDLAARLERFHTQNNTFAGATVAGLGATNPTPEGNYNLTISAQGANTFTIQAAPVAGTTQASDDCGSFTLTNTGLQNVTGSLAVADCWKR